MGNNLTPLIEMSTDDLVHPRQHITTCGIGGRVDPMTVWFVERGHSVQLARTRTDSDTILGDGWAKR